MKSGLLGLVRAFVLLAAVGAGLYAVPSRRMTAQQTSGTASLSRDQQAIARLIADQYVSAVFVTRDEKAVREGFHPKFHLMVFDSDTVIVAPLDMWLDRLGLDGKRSAKTFRHEVAFINVAGDAAVARTELFQDGRHIYTDYFGLYRFSSGWQIVTKTFQDRD